MATSTTPQPDTAERPENSTTSVDANREILNSKMCTKRLLGHDITLIVEPDIYGFTFFGCLASPNPVFVFHQTGNVGVENGCAVS